MLPLTMTSGKAIQPKFIPSKIQDKNRPDIITQGLLIENVVLFWDANVPTQPPSLIPTCILGSHPLASFPGHTYSRSRAGPCQGAPQPGSLALVLLLAPYAAHSALDPSSQ